MATVSIVLKTSKKLSNSEYSVALRVTHQRNSRYITISSLIIDQSKKFRCSIENWKSASIEDNGFGRFSKVVQNYKQLNSTLEKILSSARKILAKYDQTDEPFNFDDFENDLRGNKKLEAPVPVDLSLQAYYTTLIGELEAQRKIGLSTVYIDTKNILLKFSPDALLREVNIKFLESLESYLRHQRGNKDTTISVKMRNIQRVLNLAISEKLINRDDYPFGETRYSINKRLNHKTRKRAISVDLLKRIFNCDLGDNPKLLLARNIFQFSYYARGMNFIDIACLKWTDISNNTIAYVRKKTKQPFYIPVNSFLQSILDYYKSLYPENRYVFPIYDDLVHVSDKQKYTRKKTALKMINDNLRVIAKAAGIDTNLTTYVSRHTYATNLKNAGVATSVIKEALGHQTEEQTQTYLDGFDESYITGMEVKLFASLDSCKNS